MLLCPNCFADPELHGLVKATSNTNGNCEACHSREVAVLDHSEILSLFQKFADIFEINEEGDTFSNVVQNDWGVFVNATVASRVLRSIVPDLDGIGSQDDLVKYIPDIQESVDHWDIFKKQLKEESRFIIDIGNLAEFRWDAAFNQQAEFKTETGQDFYRARIHHVSGQDAYPQDKMGTPPLHLRSGGRANAFGIPVLYLSLELVTTLYETRSSLHDELSIGLFRINEGQSLELVDFTSIPSLFTGADMQQIAISKLLCQKISEDLSKPMRRYDSELEYVPTQFICEYIRSVTNADGILFNSSVFNNGKNAVVWNKEKLTCRNVRKYKIEGLEISYSEIR